MQKYTSIIQLCTLEALGEQRTHFGVDQLLQISALELRIAARVALVSRACRLAGQRRERGEIGRELQRGRDARADARRRGEVAREELRAAHSVAAALAPEQVARQVACDFCSREDQVGAVRAVRTSARVHHLRLRAVQRTENSRVGRRTGGFGRFGIRMSIR